MSSSYTRPCKYCNRTIQLRHMPAGQWVAFEGYETHKCLTKPSARKNSFNKGKVENANKKPGADIYSDLDFFDINLPNQQGNVINVSDCKNSVSAPESDQPSSKDLSVQILYIIKNSTEPLRTIDIAKELNQQGNTMVDRTIVNQCLYGSLKDLVYQDGNYCWLAYSKDVPSNSVKQNTVNNFNVGAGKASNFVNESNATDQQEKKESLINRPERTSSNVENKQNTPPKVIDKYSREVIYNKPSDINELKVSNLYSKPVIKEINQPKPIIKEANQSTIRNSKIDLDYIGQEKGRYSARQEGQGKNLNLVLIIVVAVLILILSICVLYLRLFVY